MGKTKCKGGIENSGQIAVLGNDERIFRPGALHDFSALFPIQETTLRIVHRGACGLQTEVSAQLFFHRIDGAVFRALDGKIPLLVDVQLHDIALQGIVGSFYLNLVLVGIDGIGRQGNLNMPLMLDIVASVHIHGFQQRLIVETSVLIRDIQAQFVLSVGIHGVLGARIKRVGNIQDNVLAAVMRHLQGAYSIDAQNGIVDEQYIVHPKFIALHHFAEIIAGRKTHQQIGGIILTFVGDGQTDALPIGIRDFAGGRTDYRTHRRSVGIAIFQLGIVMQIHREVCRTASVSPLLGPKDHRVGTTRKFPTFGTVTGIGIDAGFFIISISNKIQCTRCQSSHLSRSTSKPMGNIRPS